MAPPRNEDKRHAREGGHPSHAASAPADAANKSTIEQMELDARLRRHDKENNCISLLRHDLAQHLRRPAEGAALILFFLIVVLILPFAIGPDPDLLRRLAPGLIWIAALLMNLLALDRLFVQDERDGTLDLLLLSPIPLPLLISSKLLAQTLAILAALIPITAIAGAMLNMSPQVLPILLLSLAIGIPSLVMLGGLLSAITATLRRNPALLTALLIPMAIPILIFAAGACDAAAMGTSPMPPLLLLAALLSFLLPTAPFAIAAVLRQR
ncbi:MAG: heme exporter protein CcmB [Bdellovibrionales bacterium]